VRVTERGGWSAAWLAVLSAGLLAQAPPSPPAAASRGPQPTFRVRVDLVSLDVIPRDDKGNFVSDLTKGDFKVYEDGVMQDITSMTMSHGGHVTNLLVPPTSSAPEGILLPAARPVDNISGRIFVFLIDDLHLQFQNTPRIRDLFKQIGDSLVHDGDMFGIISTGTSAISVQMTYDRHRFDEAVDELAGNELSPEDIIKTTEGGQGPTEVKWRAHVAFSTVNALLESLEKVHNRRKAQVYLSDGYDFNPFQDARLGVMDPTSPFLENPTSRDINASVAGPNPQPNSSRQVLQQKQVAQFGDTELANELGALTREANRANVTIYTIDPRGVVAGVADVDQTIDPQQLQDYVTKSQGSLRLLAEDTGGIAVVNQNTLDVALKRIDADTSDYYILAYYSNNPDTTARRRRIDVQVNRSGRKVEVWSRKEYVLKTEPATDAPPTIPSARPR
jgi:VWFA-related protein